jgi:hypothetical protein
MKPTSSPRYRSLFLALALSTAILLFGVFVIDDLTGEKLVSKLLWPLSRLMIFISIGLIAGQLIEAAGWTRTFGALAGPVFKRANLNSRCSAAFTTAFISGAAANSMLLDFYRDHKITRRQLFLTNFINQFPAYFLHLPTTFFVVIPLTGRAGALYFLITFAAVLFRTSLFLSYGYLLPDKIKETGPVEEILQKERPVDNNKTRVLKGVREKFPKRVTNIAIYVVPVYVLVFVINSMGIFGEMRTWLAQYVVTSFVPIEALSMVVLSFAAEFTSGFAAAGALQNEGILTMKQTVLALIMGNIVAFPVRALRHQLPRYIGIFSPKMGTQLLLLGQGFRVTSLLMVGIVFYYLWPS